MKETVRPSHLAAQPIGEASRVSEDVYQLKLPVPFPLKFIASYLVEGRDGWTVIDPGFDYPPAREAWEVRASSVGLDFGNIARIVVTHLHPDHIGLARWLQVRSGAPVFMLEDEIRNARHVWDPDWGVEAFVGFLVRNGMDAKTAEATAGTTRLGVRLPERMEALREGDVVPVGDRASRIIHTPGHSDYHFVLHDRERRLLFAGDHVLLRITPNIGLWTYTEPRPLERYLESLEGLRGLGVDLVLPGHGPIFHDLDGRIDELISHHAERLSEMHALLDGKPATPYEVAHRHFPQDLTDHQLRFALAETLAHLEHLVGEGRAERLDGEVVSYRAV